MTRDVPVLSPMHLPSQWTSSYSQEVSSCSLVWPGVTYSVWLWGLSVNFPPLVIKMSPPFSMPSPRLLDPPHRRGDLVSTAWRWIKDGLAMAVQGQGRSDGLGDTAETIGERRGIERACCHCVTAFVVGNYAICLSGRVVCSQSKAVRWSLTLTGLDSMYKMTVD